MAKESCRHRSKKAVVLNLKEYERTLESIEDLEDANDLLWAERETVSFTPYEQFRNTWVKVGYKL